MKIKISLLFLFFSFSFTAIHAQGEAAVPFLYVNPSPQFYTSLTSFENQVLINYIHQINH
ncbi:MAG: hypothetical protein EHM47_12885 [Ignavibacteriales bacterium]|nr:MAG: hypothetical protein EHM47_15530 [Ignavibacteriales bacterium]RPI70012.1 MAG: hypothetical protein EHM47_12885 [Ignavibacteriales bacterium]